MLTCIQIRRQLSEYLFGELLPTSLPKFNEHIEHCDSCFQEMQELKYTLGLVTQHQEPILYPSELDWKRFSIQLHARLAELQPPVVNARYSDIIFNWLRKVIIPQPAWATTMAAITTLILLVFQGSILSNHLITHSINISNFKSNNTLAQLIPNCERPMEKRIALTKDIFEKTKS